MTTESPDNIWTHGTGAAKAPHQWEYLGRVAQAYRCRTCPLRVSKAEMKVKTDA